MSVDGLIIAKFLAEVGISTNELKCIAELDGQVDDMVRAKFRKLFREALCNKLLNEEVEVSPTPVVRSEPTTSKKQNTQIKAAKFTI